MFGRIVKERVGGAVVPPVRGRCGRRTEPVAGLRLPAQRVIESGTNVSSVDRRHAGVLNSFGKGDGNGDLG